MTIEDVASMLAPKQAGQEKDLKKKMLLFLESAAAENNSRLPFLNVALDTINYRVSSLGISQKDLRVIDSLTGVAARMLPAINFDKSHSRPFQYIGRGKVTCSNGVLKIYSANVDESGVTAFSLDGRIEVITRNARDEKLKSSGQNDAQALAEFASSFLSAQAAFARSVPGRRECLDGDKVDIRITGYEKGNTGRACESLEAENPIRGAILDEELCKGLFTRDIMPYLLTRDCIEGAVVRIGEKIRFSIRDAYLDYAKSRANRDRKNGTAVEARVVRVFKDLGRATLLTANGYGATCSLADFPELKKEDIVLGNISTINDSAAGVFINYVRAKDVSKGIVRMGDDDDLLGDFVCSEEVVTESLQENKYVVDNNEAVESIRSLASILCHTSASAGSMELYKHLLVAEFLYMVIGDDAAIESLAPRIAFLQKCLAFAQGYSVRGQLPGGLTDEEASALRLLELWDRPAKEIFETGIAPGEETLQSKIAMLLLGLRASAQYADEVQAKSEDVRKRICALLGVADAYRQDATLRTGKYGLIENHEVEFKSSYVYRNDGRGPDLDYQGRGQVFEAVCAFLNADGGTLYLGVRDDGDPILSSDSGLHGDIAWLSANYVSICKIRAHQLGHPVCKVESIDNFVQFLNCEKELYFKESLHGNIIIEATEDADAIRIIVKPSEYEIAYLYSDKKRNDGKAFVRDGGRTMEMTRVQKEKRLMALKKLGKEAEFEVIFQEAIDRKRKLILRGYASGNSGEVRARRVVPLYLFYNNENVYCYDLDNKSYRQFRLHRIAAIEYDQDESPYTLPVEQQRNVDVFRWLDAGKKYHLRLSMAVAAKNYLMEEFSMAEQLPEEQFHVDPSDPNKWILDTCLYDLRGFRRFYLGVAEWVEILPTEDSEEIIADIAKFVRENIAM